LEIASYSSSKFVKLPSSVGIVPENWLESRNLI